MPFSLHLVISVSELVIFSEKSLILTKGVCSTGLNGQCFSVLITKMYNQGNKLIDMCVHVSVDYLMCLKPKESVTSTCIRYNGFIGSFGQKENLSIFAIFHHNWHPFSIRSELQSVQYFILNHRSIEVDFCNTSN